MFFLSLFSYIRFATIFPFAIDCVIQFVVNHNVFGWTVVCMCVFFILGSQLSEIDVAYLTTEATET